MAMIVSLCLPLWPLDENKSAKTVDTNEAYDGPRSGQTHILLQNQAIQVKDLANHLTCPMKCRSNGVHINKVPKYITDGLNETTNAI